MDAALVFKYLTLVEYKRKDAYLQLHFGNNSTNMGKAVSTSYHLTSFRNPYILYQKYQGTKSFRYAVMTNAIFDKADGLTYLRQSESDVFLDIGYKCMLYVHNVFTYVFLTRFAFR